jgi:hypothetical protein
VHLNAGIRQGGVVADRRGQGQYYTEDFHDASGCGYIPIPQPGARVHGAVDGVASFDFEVGPASRQPDGTARKAHRPGFRPVFPHARHRRKRRKISTNQSIKLSIISDDARFSVYSWQSIPKKQVNDAGLPSAGLLFKT